MSATRTKRRSTYDELPDAPDQELEDQRAKRGAPWCDTCQRPSIGNSGLQHVTAEHPYGVPKEWDDSGHDVTHRQWFDTPASRTDEEIAEQRRKSIVDALVMTECMRNDRGRWVKPAFDEAGRMADVALAVLGFTPAQEES